MSYAVETLFINTWENCWRDAKGSAVVFATRAAAKRAITNHIEECRFAVRAGFLQDSPHRSDFRIVKVT